MARKALAGTVLVGATVLLAALAITIAVPLVTVAPPTEKHADLPSALIRAGLDAEALAASGLTSGETTTLVGLVNTHLQGEEETLSGLDATYASARVGRDELKRKIQSGLATDQEVASFPQAESDLAAAEAPREAFLDDVVTAGTAQLSADEQATLAAIRSNRSWKLPVQYLVVDRTEEEWVALRDALANLRIMPELGEEPDQECEDHVATCDLDADVAAAESSLDSNGSSVEGSWETATSRSDRSGRCRRSMSPRAFSRSCCRVRKPTSFVASSIPSPAPGASRGRRYGVHRIPTADARVSGGFEPGLHSSSVESSWRAVVECLA